MEIKTDDSTADYLNSNIGRLRQLTRIRLMWLCDKWGISGITPQTTSEVMIQRCAETGFAVPAPHEIEKPSHWNEKKRPTEKELKAERDKQLAAIAEEKKALENPQPVTGTADVTGGEETDPHKISNFFHLKDFMKKQGFEFDNKVKKKDLLKMWDNREA